MPSSSSKVPRDTGTFEFPYEGSIPEPIIHDNLKIDLPSQDFIDEINDPSFFQGDFVFVESSSSSSSCSSSSCSSSRSSFPSSSCSSSSCSSSRSSFSPSSSSHSSTSSYSCSSSSCSSSSCSSSFSSCSSSHSISSSSSVSSSSSSRSLGAMVISNAAVVPAVFRSGDTICASYDYSGEYPESGSQIRWYRNGVYQPTWDNQICFEVTGQRGDEWEFYVTPCDAFHCGSPVESTPGVIINNPPTAPTRVEIVPHNPQVEDDLFAVVGGSTDADGDSIVYHIWWYRVRSSVTEELVAYRNRLTVPYTEVEEGDVFSIEARAFDGTDESS